MSGDEFENPFSVTTNEPSECVCLCVCDHKFGTTEKRGTQEKHFLLSNAEENLPRPIGIWMASILAGLWRVQTPTTKKQNQQKFIVQENNDILLPRSRFSCHVLSHIFRCPKMFHRIHILLSRYTFIVSSLALLLHSDVSLQFYFSFSSAPFSHSKCHLS